MFSMAFMKNIDSQLASWKQNLNLFCHKLSNGSLGMGLWMAVKIWGDSMKATRHLHFQDFIGWWMGLMYLTPSLTLCPLELISVSTIHNFIWRALVPYPNWWAHVCSLYWSLNLICINHQCIVLLSSTFLLTPTSWLLNVLLTSWNVCLYLCNGLTDRKRPIFFTMARLDWVKNLIGLVDMFGKDAKHNE
jgi:hypothetical protein